MFTSDFLEQLLITPSKLVEGQEGEKEEEEEGGKELGLMCAPVPGSARSQGIRWRRCNVSLAYSSVRVRASKRPGLCSAGRGCPSRRGWFTSRADVAGTAACPAGATEEEEEVGVLEGGQAWEEDEEEAGSGGT